MDGMAKIRIVGFLAQTYLDQDKFQPMTICQMMDILGGQILNKNITGHFY